METTPTPTPCLNCERLQRQVQVLEQAVATLSEQVRTLQTQLAAATKNSSTSSKPPSSDIVKPPLPPPAPGQPPRRRGGQPGHPRHQRSLVAPELVNAGFFDHTLDSCPDCGHSVDPLDDAPRVVQQIDLPHAPVLIAEHRSHRAFCPRCQKTHFAPLPPTIENGGLIGPRLTTLIAYLKGVCHASFSTIRLFLRDVVGVTISRGQLANTIAKKRRSLATALRGTARSLAE